MSATRLIVLDTETTGIDPKAGHQIIEIGCVEIIDRRVTDQHYHQYIRPKKSVEAEALAIHGISNEFLADKPAFGEIIDEFWAFIAGSELIIHNAPFDLGHIDAELQRLKHAPAKTVTQSCTVIDTLIMARQKHPGQRNSLDALCKRYNIDNSNRQLHGALLDSEILAEVYLAMTGGQLELNLQFEGAPSSKQQQAQTIDRSAALPVVVANEQELALHQQFIERIGAQQW